MRILDSLAQIAVFDVGQTFISDFRGGRDGKLEKMINRQLKFPKEEKKMLSRSLRNLCISNDHIDRRLDHILTSDVNGNR